MVLLLTLEEHSIDCFLYLFVLCSRVQIYFYVSLINEIAGSDCIDILGVISHLFSCVLSSDRWSCLFEPPGSGVHSRGAEDSCEAARVCLNITSSSSAHPSIASLETHVGQHLDSYGDVLLRQQQGKIAGFDSSTIENLASTKEKKKKKWLCCSL